MSTKTDTNNGHTVAAPIFSLACPVPQYAGETIQLSHGGGGKIMRRLLNDVVFPALGGDGNLQENTDAASLPIPLSGRLAFTTDSYVTRPLIFPGGDIGSLAIHGTVNDLAMSGAQPQYLSVGLIAEEGLPISTLRQILGSMAKAAAEVGIHIVTGDTKVVDRGKGDGLYINTAGIGIIDGRVPFMSPAAIGVGDAVIINGDLGRHGIAVMACREGLEFESAIESDSAPLADLVQLLLAAEIEIHCMRDLTRGGLSSGLNEIADTARLSISLDETVIPVREDVRGACEMLGLDPLYVANEGRFAAIVAAKDAERAVRIMRTHKHGTGATCIGQVQARGQVPVVLRTAIGPTRILDMLSGEQLPRIC